MRGLEKNLPKLQYKRTAKIRDCLLETTAARELWQLFLLGVLWAEDKHGQIS